MRLMPLGRPAVGPREGEEGVTILEVMIAAAVLAIASLGLISLITASSQLDSISQEKLKDIELANQIMEECRDTSFNDLPNLDGNIVETDGGVATIYVTPVQSALLQVEVIVHRKNPSGMYHEYRLTTYRAMR